MVSYAPYFISTVVICGMITIFLKPDTGVFNIIRGVFGMESTDLLARPEWFKTIYVWSGVWQGMGWSSIIYISALSGVDPQLHEAAIVDGCGFFQTYWKIMFPLSKPIIVTVVIMQFIWTWNSFLLPLVLTLSKPDLRTLAVGLYALKGEHVVDWTGIAAGATIAVLPIIIVFICLQKYFVNGIAGAVKS